MTRVIPRVASAAGLLAAFLMLRWPPHRLEERRASAGDRPGQLWSRWAIATVVALWAVGSPATLARAPRPSGPVAPALVALDPPGLQAGAAYGTSVATAATVAVIGVPMLAGGLAFVYTRDAGGWRETAELHGSDTQAGDFFGGAVAIAGGTIVIGADDHGATGRAYVFTHDRSGWHQVAELAGSGAPPGSGFGYSVAVGAGTIVVGAPMPAVGTGTAYVFANHGRGWHQVSRLRGRNAPLDGLFGTAVAVSGQVAAVGDPGDTDGAGRVYVFSSTLGRWVQTAELAGRDSRPGDNFGFSVAETASQILVGAPWHGAGAAYVFSASVGRWRQTAELTGRGTRADGGFGYSVALGPGLAVVGAPRQNAGRAYLFGQSRAGWRQAAALAGPTANGSYFGAASAVSRTAVVIGANGYRGGTGAAWAATPSGVG